MNNPLHLTSTRGNPILHDLAPGCQKSLGDLCYSLLCSIGLLNHTTGNGSVQRSTTRLLERKGGQSPPWRSVRWQKRRPVQHS